MKQTIVAIILVAGFGTQTFADCIALDQETERKIAELGAQSQAASGSCQSLRILDQMMKVMTHFLETCPEADPGQRQIEEVRKSHQGVKDGINAICS